MRKTTPEQEQTHHEQPFNDVDMAENDNNKEHQDTEMHETTPEPEQPEHEPPIIDSEMPDVDEKKQQVHTYPILLQNKVYFQDGSSEFVELSDRPLPAPILVTESLCKIEQEIRQIDNMSNSLDGQSPSIPEVRMCQLQIRSTFIFFQTFSNPQPPMIFPPQVRMCQLQIRLTFIFFSDLVDVKFKFPTSGTNVSS